MRGMHIDDRIERRDEPRLRVATLNLWGDFGDWSQRRRVLLDAWSAVDADVLLLQEVHRDNRRDQLADLREDLGYPYSARAVGHRSGPAGDESVALLSRLPLRHAEAIPLAPSLPTRSLLVGEVLVGGQLVRVASAHTVVRPDSVLQEQLVQAAGLAGARLVVGCDLNAAPDRVAGVLRRSALADVLGDETAPTWPCCPLEHFARTWTERTGRDVDFLIEPRRLDYVLVRGLRAVATRMLALGSPAGAVVSDHACVVADLALGGVPAGGGDGLQERHDVSVPARR